MKNDLFYSEFLPLDGQIFTVDKVKYTIHAKIHHAIYPYKHYYVYLSAEYKEDVGKIWFIDLKQSESIICEKLFKKLHKNLAGIK